MGKQAITNFEELAGTVDELREILRALVAGLVADGFTDREARAIIAGSLARQLDDGDDD